MSFDAGFFARTMQKTPCAFGTSAASGELLWCNDAFAAQFGTISDRCDEVGSRLRDACPNLEQLLEHGGSETLQLTVPTLFRVTSVADERRHLELVPLDERAVDAAEDRRLYERTPAMLLTLDENQHIVAISDRALMKLGLDRETVLGRHVETFCSGRWPRGSCLDQDVSFTSPGGEPIELRLSQSPRGSAGGMSVVLRAAERVRALEAELESARRAAEELVESAPLPVIVTDPQGKVLLVNSAYEHTFAVKRAELLGHEVHNRFLVDIRHVEEIGRAIVESPVGRVSRRLRWQRHDGRVFPGMLTVVSISNGEGDVVAYLSTIHDDTEIEAYDRELRASVRLLDELAFIASHDLRAPLRAIRQLSSFLRDASEKACDGLPEVPASHLDQILSRTARLEALIDGLLRFARADDVRADAEAVDLRELALRIWREQLGPDTDEHFELVLDAELPTLPGAAVSLGHVLANLFSNAVKHHDRERGTVRLSVTRFRDSLADAESENVSWMIDVEDDGPGVPAEFHGEMFKLFRTLRSRDAVEGSGMGLAIVQRAVESRGGEVFVQSPVADGRGMRITLRWPERALPSPFKPTLLSRFHSLEESGDIVPGEG